MPVGQISFRQRQQQLITVLAAQQMIIVPDENNRFFQIRCLQHFDNPLTGRRITRQFLPGQRSSIYTSSLQRFDKATPKSRFRSCITGIPQHIYRKRKQHFFHSSRFTITERGSRNCQRHCQNLSQTFFQSWLQIYFFRKSFGFFLHRFYPFKDYDYSSAQLFIIVILYRKCQFKYRVFNIQKHIFK